MPLAAYGARRSSSESRIEPALRHAPPAAALGALLLAVTALLGWWTGNPVLTTFVQGQASMKVTTALTLAALAIALWLTRDPERTTHRRLLAARVLVVAAMAVSALVLAQYVTGISFGIDELFVEDVGSARTSHPGRGSPGTALGAILVGIGILATTAHRRLVRVADVALLGALAIGLLTLTGFLFEVEILTGASAATTGMAVPTLAALLLLAIGAFFARPAEGAARVFLLDAPAGKLLRRLLPLSVGIPLLLGAVAAAGARVGFYDTTTRLALVVVGTSTILAFLAYRAAVRLEREEAARMRALREGRERVEREVRLRTAELQEALGRLSRALRDRQRLATVVETTREGVLSADLDGRIVTWNGGAESLYGYSRAEAVGQRVVDLLIPEDERERAGRILARVRSGEKVQAETTRVRKDGTRLTVQVDAFPVRDEVGRIVGIGSISHDVTAAKQLEAALQRSNRDLQQFAYAASHDLQAPLRHVQGYATLLAQRAGERLDEREREYVARITEGTSRMQELIEDLLQLSRVEARGGPLVPLPLARPCERALDMLRPSLEEAGGEVEVGELPVIDGDDTQLTSVFLNLIQNSIKFRDPARPLRVRIGAARELDGSWRVEVEDNGRGFEPEQAERIFRMFTRLLPRTVPGTGIGLALCRRIVERHGGRIEAEGEPDVGSRFTITFPPPQRRLSA